MVRKAIIILLLIATGVSGAAWVKWVCIDSAPFYWQTQRWLTGTSYIECKAMEHQQWLPDAFGTGSGGIGITYAKRQQPGSSSYPLHLSLGGFAVEQGVMGIYSMPTSLQIQRLVVPLWFPVVLFGFYPALALIRGPLRRWKRREEGRCVACNYDLSGNESGICPECGTSVAG